MQNESCEVVREKSAHILFHFDEVSLEREDDSLHDGALVFRTLLVAVHFALETVRGIGATH